jgi:hypothetical protein
MLKKFLVCSSLAALALWPYSVTSSGRLAIAVNGSPSLRENQQIAVAPGDRLDYPYNSARVVSTGYGNVSIPLLRSQSGGLQAITHFSAGRYQVRVRKLTNPYSFLDFRTFNGAVGVVITGTELSFLRNHDQTTIAMASGTGQIKAAGFEPINISENQGVFAVDGQQPIVFEGFDKIMGISRLNISRIGARRIASGCVELGNSVQIDGAFVPLDEGRCFRAKIANPEILVINPVGSERIHSLQFQRFFGTGP